MPKINSHNVEWKTEKTIRGSNTGQAQRVFQYEKRWHLKKKYLFVELHVLSTALSVDIKKKKKKRSIVY